MRCRFVAVCTGARDANPSALAARLALALGGPIRFDEGAWQPAASIGWTLGRADDDTASILRRADAEMFRCKRDRQAADRSPAS